MPVIAQSGTYSRALEPLTRPGPLRCSQGGITSKIAATNVRLGSPTLTRGLQDRRLGDGRRGSS